MSSLENVGFDDYVYEIERTWAGIFKYRVKIWERDDYLRRNEPAERFAPLAYPKDYAFADTLFGARRAARKAIRNLIKARVHPTVVETRTVTGWHDGVLVESGEDDE